MPCSRTALEGFVWVTLVDAQVLSVVVLPTGFARPLPFRIQPVMILEMTIPVVLPCEPLFAVRFGAREGAWTPATLVNRIRDATT